jgi:NitT/TauT family transport system substrate-binding protein
VAAGHVNIFADIGLYVAAAKGYFKEEGLDVSLEGFRNTGEQVPALTGNQVQFGGMSPDPALFNAVARDIPLRLVSEKSRNSPTHGAGALVARMDLYESGALGELSQLRGKEVASPTTTGSPRRYLEIALARGGLALDDITVTQIPFPDMPAALANKSLDAAWMNEPYLTLAQERGFGRALVRASELYPNLVTTFLVISARFAQENPEIANRFVTAYLRGQRDYYHAFQLRQDEALRQEIIQIAVKETTVKDPALYERIGSHAVEPNGFLDVPVIADMQDWYVRQGLIPQPVDVNALVDRQYLDYALQRLGTLPDPYR